MLTDLSKKNKAHSDVPRYAGRACGVSRPVIACSVIVNEFSQLKVTSCQRRLRASLQSFLPPVAGGRVDSDKCPVGPVPGCVWRGGIARPRPFAGLVYIGPQNQIQSLKLAIEKLLI